MKNQKNKLVKHISVRLTWHDNGWNGDSCSDPKSNLSCQQDANLFIHKTKVVKNDECCTNLQKADEYIKKYLNQNKCFLHFSKLGYICKIHSSHLLNENGLSNIPPCDSFSAFAPENPYVHTKNPARKMDRYDKEALNKCKGNKEPWKYIRNWKQVKYFPQDYRKHVVEGNSIALFYTVNFPEESGKFIIGYSVIKGKNEEFQAFGKGKTEIPNKSNAGNRWGEEWCFLLNENDRFRFPFQELINSNNTDLLDQAKNILKVEPQDEIYFRNLSMFVPDHILVKYFKKLKQAVELLLLHNPEILEGSEDVFSKLDNKVQTLKKSSIKFKYPALPAIGRLLGWWNAFADYEENLEEEENFKEKFFNAIKNKEFKFEINGKNFFIGSKKNNIYPADNYSEDFINLLEEILIYYPIKDEKVLQRIYLLIEKGILTVKEIRENPYILFEKFVPTLDGSVSLSFEDVDYGEYKRAISIFKSQENKDKNKAKKDFYLNPYRIRALIHEYFKVYKDDPGYVWVSFKDIENYVRKRLSTGVGTGGCNFNFESILNSTKISETIEIDHEKKFLSLKKLVYMEKFVKNKIEDLLNKSLEISKVNIKDVIKEVLPTISNDEIKEKEETMKKLLSNKFTFVSGVAGAGKSTVIKIFTKVLDKLQENYKILTPTGKASERLRGEDLESDTIHYFLKSNGFLDNDLFVFTESGNIQEIENLIIDEISMVPLDLLYYLLNAVNLESVKRIIFVGDIKQLPPIGYGYPAKDIYNYLDKKSPNNLIKLEKSYRSNDKFIEIANKLRDQNIEPKDLEPFFVEKINNLNFQILKFNGKEELERLIEEIIQKEKITEKKLAGNPEYFQILTPKKEGYAGSKHINRFIMNLFKQDKFDWNNTKVIKLINTYCKENNKNCEETFNGMIGIIKDKKIIEFSGGQKISFSPEKLGYEYDYAYAITVHKSQGSEFDIVLTVLPKNIGGLFTRELLYTALTRAKKKLYFLVEDENMLYETPDEIIRSGCLFEPNFVELPEELTYISPNGNKILKKLDLYIASILDLENKEYIYKAPNADFHLKQEGIDIHLIDLNTYPGRLKNEVITENEKNLKLELSNEINVRKLIEKLGLSYNDRSNENKKDYREQIREDIQKNENIYIEPDTNLKVITHNGLITRSISEAILMLLFDHKNFKYEYEKEIYINGKRLLPDFYFPEKNVYWEHLGMLDDPFYMESWKRKRGIYESAGIKVIKLDEWNGEEKCCIFTTEEDIKNLKNLRSKIDAKGNFITTGKYQK